jgi:hypothetical protein
MNLSSGKAEDGDRKSLVIVALLAYEISYDRHSDLHRIWFTVNNYGQKSGAFIQRDIGHGVRACLRESFSLVLFSDGVAIDRATTTSDEMDERAAVKAVSANAAWSMLNQPTGVAFLQNELVTACALPKATRFP